MENVIEVDVGAESVEDNFKQLITDGASTSIVKPASNNAVEIPIVIEATLGETETVVEQIRDNTLSEQTDDSNLSSSFNFDEHPASNTRFQNLKTEDSLFPENGNVASSFSSQPNEEEREIIDLTDPTSIIPKIPGNDHSFIFAKFGSGKDATSFGLNLNNIVNLDDRFRTKFNNVIIRGDQKKQPTSPPIIFTTPTPTTTTRKFFEESFRTNVNNNNNNIRTEQRRKPTSPPVLFTKTTKTITTPLVFFTTPTVSRFVVTTQSTTTATTTIPTTKTTSTTTRRPRSSTLRTVRTTIRPKEASSFTFNSFNQVTTKSPVITVTRRPTEVTTETSKPIVFTQKPVKFEQSPRKTLKSQRLKLQTSRPKGVPGFEIFKLSATPTPETQPFQIVTGVKPPPRPRGNPPTRAPMFHVFSPTPTIISTPAPVPVRFPSKPSETHVKTVTRQPLFVFSTPSSIVSSTAPAVSPTVSPPVLSQFSVSISPHHVQHGPLVSQQQKMRLAPEKKPARQTAVPVSIKPFISQSTSGLNEISIPINISEIAPTDVVSNNNNQLDNGNRNNKNQLARKPKNQFLTGNPIGNSFNSPFVFLRQQLQEVKHNIVLPSGVTNPFQNSRIPQNVRPTPFSPIVFNQAGSLRPVQPIQTQTLRPIQPVQTQTLRPIQPIQAQTLRPIQPVQTQTFGPSQSFFSLGPTQAPVVLESSSPSSRPLLSTPQPFQQSFFSLGQSPKPVQPTVNTISNSKPLPQGTFVFRDPTIPVLSPVSPTPIPLASLTSSPPTVAINNVPQSTFAPIVFSQPTIQSLPNVLIEEDRNTAAEQQISLIIEETVSDANGSQTSVPNEVDNKSEPNPSRPTDNKNIHHTATDINNSPLFDPRKRQFARKPSSTTASPILSITPDVTETSFKGRKPVLDAHNELDTITDDLTERLRRLKESIRKTKESLTSQQQTFFTQAPVTIPSIPTVAPVVRKRVKHRKRIPARQRLRNKEEINIPINIVESPTSETRNPAKIKERPRSRGRGRGRGRGKKINSSSKNKIIDIEEKKSEQEKKNDRLEKELEDTYGEEVVQGLLGVLVKAVSHPDKDRILKQLKGQLAAMNVNDVKKLQFGVETRPYSASTTTTTEASTLKEEIFDVTTISSPLSETEDKSEFESALEAQLRRVANLAERFKNNKPVFINSEKQLIKSKLSTQKPVVVPKKLGNRLDSKIAHTKDNLRQFSPTIRPQIVEKSTEHTVSALSTTLRNLFSTERIPKIKLPPTTPVPSIEDGFQSILDGIPNGEPGLKSNFFERVPYIPEDVPTLLDVTTTEPPVTSANLKIAENNLESENVIAENNKVDEMPQEKASENLFDEMEVKELMKEEKQKVKDEINIQLVIANMPEAEKIEKDIKMALQNTDVGDIMMESSRTEAEIQNLHSHMTVHNKLPTAEKIEKEIVKNHQLKHIDELIPNDISQDKKQTKSQNLIKIENANPNIEPNKSDADLKNANEKRLNMKFNSSDLLLTNFMVHKPSNMKDKERIKTEGVHAANNANLKPKENELLEDVTTQKTVDPTTNKMIEVLKVETPITTPATTTTAVSNKIKDENFKNRRRKLFRALNSDSELKEKLVSKLRKSDKLKFRKLFRNKVSNSSHTELELKTSEKESPRKIIFRKNLIRKDFT